MGDSDGNVNVDLCSVESECPGQMKQKENIVDLKTKNSELAVVCI